MVLLQLLYFIDSCYPHLLLLHTLYRHFRKHYKTSNTMCRPLDHYSEELKNSIFEKYGLPLVRFKTNESSERERLISELTEIAC